MKFIVHNTNNIYLLIIQFCDLNVIYIVIILFTFTLSIFVYAHIVSMQSRVIKCLGDKIFVLSIAMLLYLLSKVFIEFPQLINFYRHATGFISAIYQQSDHNQSNKDESTFVKYISCVFLTVALYFNQKQRMFAICIISMMRNPELI